MFVGHYSAAFAAKSLEPRLPLWLLFLAAQAVDIAWALLVLGGVERARIVPDFTASNPLDLYYMPYTHSLLATLFWSGLAFLAWRRFGGALGGVRPAALVAAVVASHWLLDLPVHVRDLPLYDDTAKMGFGLWRLPVLAFTLEIWLLFAGMLAYIRRGRAPVHRHLRIALMASGLLVLQAAMYFGPTPTSLTFVLLAALGMYLALAWSAFLLEAN